MKSLTRRTTAPRTGTRRRLLTTGALLAIGVLPPSACSLFNPPLERDESVHAVFDAGQDIVKMPLDEYMYFETNNYAHTAFQIAMKQCFAEHGQNYTIQAPYSESAPRGDLGRTTPSRLPILKAHPAVIWDESTVPGTSSTPRSTVLRSETPTTQPPPAPITRGRA